MGYVELIETLKTLPQEKQAEVFDFVDFLALRAGLPRPATDQAKPAPPRPLASYLAAPFQVPDFTALTREEANARHP
jgi:hypothetical protein